MTATRTLNHEIEQAAREKEEEAQQKHNIEQEANLAALGQAARVSGASAFALKIVGRNYIAVILYFKKPFNYTYINSR